MYVFMLCNIVTAHNQYQRLWVCIGFLSPMRKKTTDSPSKIVGGNPQELLVSHPYNRW